MIVALEQGGQSKEQGGESRNPALPVESKEYARQTKA